MLPPFDLPLKNAFQTLMLCSSMMPYVSKWDTTQAGDASLLYSSYLGGSGKNGSCDGINGVNSIAVDLLGKPYVTGYTNSSDFPTINPFQATNFAYYHSNAAIFIAKVGKADTTTSLSPSANASSFGQPVTFTATVTSPFEIGTPTGSVTFFDGSSSLGSGALNNGQAMLTVSSLAVGSHTFSANYSGDGSCLSSTRSLNPQIVVQTSTATSVTSSANAELVGNTVTFTAHIAAAFGTPATGTVDFKDGNTILATGQPITAGVATFATSSLSAGAHLVSAVYNGDSNSLGSVSPVFTQVINNPCDAGTTTSLTATITPLHPGQAATTAMRNQNITLRATITASPGSNGTVTFTDGVTVFGSPSISSGTASLELSQQLSVGLHRIQAIYSGGGGFQGSLSTPVTVNRSPRPR